MKYLIALTLSLAVHVASAQETSDINSSVMANVTDNTPSHDDNPWSFIGCTHNEHECDHLAHSYGYHNSYATHDHYTCHHGDENHACYGRSY